MATACHGHPMMGSWGRKRTLGKNGRNLSKVWCSGNRRAAMPRSVARCWPSGTLAAEFVGTLCAARSCSKTRPSPGFEGGGFAEAGTSHLLVGVSAFSLRDDPPRRRPDSAGA